MSEIADQELNKRRLWAVPDGSHDKVVHWARRILPAGIGALVAFLVFAPLSNANGDVSFVLAKDAVDMATERMRVSAATYRGEDSKGRPFELTAGSAVQKSSREPVVVLNNLAGKITLAEGPATIAAQAGRYDMDREVVMVDGPVTFQSANGYKLSTRDVAIGLKTRKLVSAGAVEGEMPIGTFSAGSMRADLDQRVVTLEGRARLRIVQGKRK